MDARLRAVRSCGGDLEKIQWSVKCLERDFEQHRPIIPYCMQDAEIGESVSCRLAFSPAMAQQKHLAILFAVDGLKDTAELRRRLDVARIQLRYSSSNHRSEDSLIVRQQQRYPGATSTSHSRLQSVLDVHIESECEHHMSTVRALSSRIAAVEQGLFSMLGSTKGANQQHHSASSPASIYSMPTSTFPQPFAPEPTTRQWETAAPPLVASRAASVSSTSQASAPALSSTLPQLSPAPILADPTEDGFDPIAAADALIAQFSARKAEPRVFGTKQTQETAQAAPLPNFDDDQVAVAPAGPFESLPNIDKPPSQPAAEEVKRLNIFEPGVTALPTHSSSRHGAELPPESNHTEQAAEEVERELAHMLLHLGASAAPTTRRVGFVGLETAGGDDGDRTTQREGEMEEEEEEQEFHDDYDDEEYDEEEEEYDEEGEEGEDFDEDEWDCIDDIDEFPPLPEHNNPIPDDDEQREQQPSAHADISLLPPEEQEPPEEAEEEHDRLLPLFNEDEREALALHSDPASEVDFPRLPDDLDASIATPKRSVSDRATSEDDGNNLSSACATPTPVGSFTATPVAKGLDKEAEAAEHVDASPEIENAVHGDEEEELQ